MKRLFLLSLSLILVLGLSSFRYSQTREAIVETKSGLAVFIMCEPVAAYEKVLVVKTSYDNSTYVGIGAIGVIMGIDGPIDRLVQRALRKGRKKNVQALITSDAKMASVIRYSGTPGVDERIKGRPVNMQGVDIYIKSRPTSAYKEVGTISLNAANRLTHPIVNADRLNKMILNLIDQAKKAGLQFSGLVTSDGVTATLISY
ncbi:MAG: hypothetical protein K1X56_14195 [Flavobacteriales bacterium]|nr:hypothetical protein [Flavobacteriales bacterium]